MAAPPTGFVPVRLHIDLGRVLAFARRELDPAFGELAAWQANNGMSNPTYLLYDPTRPGSTMYILRKKPPGKLLKSAHDIEREYRVMRALQDGGVAVPVPRIYHYCRDLAVVGTEFYVMEYVEGRVFEDDTLPGFSAAQRAALYADMVRVLAALHAADFRAIGLERHGKIGNYASRQLRTWGRQFRKGAAHLAEVYGEALGDELVRDVCAATESMEELIACVVRSRRSPAPEHCH